MDDSTLSVWEDIMVVMFVIKLALACVHSQRGRRPVRPVFAGQLQAHHDALFFTSPKKMMGKIFSLFRRFFA